MSVKQAQAAIDMEEFAWWAAYDALEPLTPPSAEQLALVAATLVNMQLSHQARRVQVVDFLPGYEAPPVRPQSPSEIERNLMMAFGMQGPSHVAPPKR